MDIEAVGKYLKAIRKKQGRTQGDIAGGANMHTSNYQDLERGEGNPTLSTLSALAKSLDVEFGAIFGYKSKALSPEQLKVLAAFDGVDPAMIDQIIKIVDLTVGLKESKDRRRGKT